MELLPVAPGRSPCQYQQTLKQRSQCGVPGCVSLGRGLALKGGVGIPESPRC